MNNQTNIDFSQVILTLALVVIVVLIPFTVKVSAEPVPSAPMQVENTQYEVVLNP
ncbi:hypothetical protein NQ117_13300 [Paenibacillus sp. SC116]|uniref:hypothetical protein n=1 Tax=Paenibacillus sp. SC116 TaxID=2968986 RepID=UPI00215A2CF1|nr:hypothetical protein [Paenibacillus sp. SC116]MCR8844660.1 hypothetical protein [Paenibacillus sp. SC116]